MYKYLFLRKEDMTDDGIIYHYRGLDTKKFLDIRYKDDLSEAVVKTLQQNIPYNITVLTEEEYNNYVTIFDAPGEKPKVIESYNNSNTNNEILDKIKQIDEAINLIIHMQLEKEGII